MSTHTCPHGGSMPVTWFDNVSESWNSGDWHCGDDGWLCRSCREDRADARAALGISSPSGSGDKAMLVSAWVALYDSDLLPQPGAGQTEGV